MDTDVRHLLALATGLMFVTSLAFVLLGSLAKPICPSGSELLTQNCTQACYNQTTLLTCNGTKPDPPDRGGIMIGGAVLFILASYMALLLFKSRPKEPPQRPINTDDASVVVV